MTFRIDTWDITSLLRRLLIVETRLGSGEVMSDSWDEEVMASLDIPVETFTLEDVEFAITGARRNFYYRCLKEIRRERALRLRNSLWPERSRQLQLLKAQYHQDFVFPDGNQGWDTPLDDTVVDLSDLTEKQLEAWRWLLSDATQDLRKTVFSTFNGAKWANEEQTVLRGTLLPSRTQRRRYHHIIQTQPWMAEQLFRFLCGWPETRLGENWGLVQLRGDDSPYPGLLINRPRQIKGVDSEEGEKREKRSLRNAIGAGLNEVLTTSMRPTENVIYYGILSDVISRDYESPKYDYLEGGLQVMSVGMMLASKLLIQAFSIPPPMDARYTTLNENKERIRFEDEWLIPYIDDLLKSEDLLSLGRLNAANGDEIEPEKPFFKNIRKEMLHSSLYLLQTVEFTLLTNYMMQTYRSVWDYNLRLFRESFRGLVLLSEDEGNRGQRSWLRDYGFTDYNTGFRKSLPDRDEGSRLEHPDFAKLSDSFNKTLLRHHNPSLNALDAGGWNARETVLEMHRRLNIEPANERAYDRHDYYQVLRFRGMGWFCERFGIQRRLGIFNWATLGGAGE